VWLHNLPLPAVNACCRRSCIKSTGQIPMFSFQRCHFLKDRTTTYECAPLVINNGYSFSFSCMWQTVWSRITDGFQYNIMPSVGLDPFRLQKEEGMPKSVMDFNNKKGSGFAGFDMGRSFASNKGPLGMERLYCQMCFYSTRKDCVTLLMTILYRTSTGPIPFTGLVTWQSRNEHWPINTFTVTLGGGWKTSMV